MATISGISASSNAQLRQQVGLLQMQLDQALRAYRSSQSHADLVTAFKIQTQIADMLLRATALHNGMSASQALDISRLA